MRRLLLLTALAAACAAGEEATVEAGAPDLPRADAESGPPTVQLLLCQAD